MKEKKEIQAEKKEILRKNGHDEYGGMDTFYLGILVWIGVCGLISAIITHVFEWHPIFIFTSITGGIILGFLDSENVKRNTLVTVENVFTNKEICNLRKGRHWARFFFLKRRNTYDNTPFTISRKLVETVSSDGTPVNADAKFEFKLVDGLAFEDVGEDDALKIICIEAQDKAEKFVKKSELDTLETTDNQDLLDFLNSNDQLVAALHRAGLIFTKVDLINVQPNQDFIDARKAKKIEEAKAIAKEVATQGRKNRIKLMQEKLKLMDTDNKLKSDEILKEAIKLINMEDGYTTEEIKDVKGFDKGTGGNPFIGV